MLYDVLGFELRFLLFSSLPTKEPSRDHDISLALSLGSVTADMIVVSGIGPRSESL